ncbi:nuclear transport factor 2 family protein [Paraburkholderia sp. J76]|uniref:nuclear transport factor 2 family protein n=1 Tax=Paraburkholderia sp. J76 TaxID=2805439 RepID=UPI002ABE3222|nr:nuclear transport factor 2 family protein [Paraburkholderia sp. J76]
MKRPCLTAFALLSIACASAAHAAQPSDDERTLQQFEQNWLEAGRTHDREALNRMLDDSYVEITPTGVQRTKAQVLKAPPPPPGATQTLRDMQVQVNGDSAVVTGIDRYQSALKGDFSDYSFYDEFARRDGVWRVVTSRMARR